MIKKLSIENYKSVKQVEIELRAINVLIGGNGAGKSNFISFFKFLHQIYAQNLQSYIAKQGGADNILHFGLKYSEYLKSEITFSEHNELRNNYQIILARTEQGNLIVERESVDYFYPSTKNWSKNSYKTNNNEVRALTEFTGYRYDYTRTYFTSFQVFHFHDTSATAKIKQPCRVQDNKILQEDGSNLSAFLYFLQQVHPKHFAKIEGVVRSIAPYFERFDLEPDRINSQFIRLEWREKGYPEKYFDATNLSDGTLRFMALATLLLQPFPPKTIIIDEPELGLHPAAIDKLAALVQQAATHTQVILSKQSVNLVNNFDTEDIITVDKKNGQSIFNHLQPDALSVWLADYAVGELWEKSIIGGQP